MRRPVKTIKVRSKLALVPWQFLVFIILGVVFLIIVAGLIYGPGQFAQKTGELLTGATESVFSKLKKSSLSKEADLGEQEIRNKLNDLAFALQKYKFQKGGCRLDYGGMPKGGPWKFLFKSDNNGNLILVATNKKNQKSYTKRVSNIKLCVVEGQAAKAFYNTYFQQKYLVSAAPYRDVDEIKVKGKESIEFGDKDFELEDKGIMYFAEQEKNGLRHICLLPTKDDPFDLWINGYCDADNGVLDDDCIGNEDEKGIATPTSNLPTCEELSCCCTDCDNSRGCEFAENCKKISKKSCGINSCKRVM